MRIESAVDLGHMDPVGGGRGHAEAAVRARRRALRRAAAGRARRSRDAPRAGRIPRGERAPRLDRGQGRPIVDQGSEGRGLLGVTRMRLGGPGWPSRRCGLPAHPARAGGRRRLGSVRADRRRQDGPARAAARAGQAVLPADVGLCVDDARSCSSMPTGAPGPLVGASPFPRHWVYDDEGQLVEKSGTIDFETWYRESYGENTPWGGEDSPAFVTAVETQLEREVTESVMQLDAKPRRRRLAPGRDAGRAGRRGRRVFVLLDGVLQVEVDGDGRRARARRDPRRAGGRRGRAADGDATGGDALPADRAGSRAHQQIRADRACALALAGGRGPKLVVTADKRCDNRRGGRKNESRPPVLTAWCPFLGRPHERSPHGDDEQAGCARRHP